MTNCVEPEPGLSVLTVITKSLAGSVVFVKLKSRLDVAPFALAVTM